MRVPYEQLYGEFRRVLLKEGFSVERAELSSTLFAEASRDGVHSHGLNRFPVYLEYIRKGFIDIHAIPEKVESMGAIERWDGHRGPGNINAYLSMGRAIELARTHGMGCVAIKNTNHWMRAGSYGWQAAEAGCIGICWTNTLPNLAPWGAIDRKIGNNPIVLAVPRDNGPIVLDVAMSQFSYGNLNAYSTRGEELPVAGGYDVEGNLTSNPDQILASGRLLPIGYWKGSGLSIMLDLIATMLSGGRSTYEVGLDEAEQAVSQVFLAFDTTVLSDRSILKEKVEQIVDDLHRSVPVQDHGAVRYPGEDTLRRRDDHLRNGVPVDPHIWQSVLNA
ncbi:3-dehydro-L-gulonate 2-dehydrogenase [Paenibacillus thalictri]|uniref:3-dehydro-L-gulonate 2-dehydrogenase n=1 Tax=Paenibacillus thalictri TaxID=2527873 RepID=A0A4Q9DNN6_9BACL|nr:3-dehydro-L-gulonate 2-dehydrogenase [Paenibacillus thalictri]TBL75165.1 3-dehydro-L-gulonate 2-dehydrogenase [Paenibacillus thalictri]